MERAEALRREEEDSFIRAIELVYLSSIKVENILDFGCGLGLTVQLLRERLGLNAIGIDLSGDFVETGFLHRGRLEELPGRYPPGYFDAIYSVEVFEHLESPGRVLSLLGTFLKPEGKILINTGTREYLKKHDPELHYIDPHCRGHISIYSLESLDHLASSIGRKAEFLGDRQYEAILSPAAGSPYPHPENIERIRRLGEWIPLLLREYMRLVFAEKPAPRAWAMQMFKTVKWCSPGLVRLLKRSRSLKKLWRRVSRS
jgi:SAM-dependent methyltransferase